MGLLALTGAFTGKAAQAVVPCESLARQEVPEMAITLAQPVSERAFTAPAHGGGPAPFHPSDTTNHVAFCRVTATLKPSGDSDIKFEMWLPLSGWNGKFLGLGDFGWAGSIMYAGLMLGLEGGYAVASHDSGHDNTLENGEFALGHPDKVIDYGYRAMHHMTLDGKALVKAFYGVAPKHSYFMGCSLGGQQALTEAQRFPADYDGVVVGAPAAPIVRLNFYQIWPTLLVNRNPAYAIPREKAGSIHDAVMKACDELDGVKDGIIEDPPSCHFDPASLRCAGADGPNCLTAEQFEFMRIMYEGPKTAKGEPIAVGTAPGNEGIMAGVNGQRRP